MAKRGESSLSVLVRRLERIDSQRREIVDSIRQATEQLLSGETPMPSKHRGSGRTTVGRRRKRKGGRPKGYKMSAATRAKLRAAWRRRKAAAGN
jgi:hypothetical protein